MTKLPTGWRWVKLGDHVTKIGSGATPRGGQSVYQQLGIPLIRSQNVLMNRFSREGLAFISSEIDEAMQQSRVIENDVLLNITGASIGRSCLVPSQICPANVNQHVSIVRSDGSILPEFLVAYFISPAMQKFINDLQAGATRQALTKTQIENFRIPLPPLNEQRRILTILKEKMAAIDRARAAAEAQLEAAQALPAAYLRQVFSSEEAKEWPRVKIDDISSLVKDGPHVTPTYVPKGIPFVTVLNIVNRKIDFSDLRYITPEDHTEFSSRAKAEPGDILYTKDGTLGIPCVVDTDREFSFFVSVALIKLMRDRADPYYIAYALESPDVLKQVERLGAGAGLKHMVLKSIRALEIPLPSLQKQQEIAGELKEKWAVVEKVQKTTQEKFDTINALPAALLRQAFAGEL